MTAKDTCCELYDGIVPTRPTRRTRSRCSLQEMAIEGMWATANRVSKLRDAQYFQRDNAINDQSGGIGIDINEFPSVV